MKVNNNMNILIIGDSWGVPNYLNIKNYPAPDEHIESYLRNFGHTVYNCSLNAGSNLESVNRAFNYFAGKVIDHPANPTSNILWEPPHFLNGKPTTVPALNTSTYRGVDYIVWFHTELIREIPMDFLRTDGINQDFTFETLYDKLAAKVYPRVLELQKQLDAKLIVIGGQTPLDSRFFSYIKPDHYKVDWTAEIVKKELPFVPIIKVGYLYLLMEQKHNVDSWDFKFQMVTNAEQKINLMTTDPVNFPDSGHPGGIPHLELSQWLQGIFLQH
jgi:hypothetical protein